MNYEYIKNVESIRFNEVSVIRVWFNGEIVWDRNYNGTYIDVFPTEVVLSEANDYTADVNIKSNGNWTFE